MEKELYGIEEQMRGRIPLKYYTLFISVVFAHKKSEELHQIAISTNPFKKFAEKVQGFDISGQSKEQIISIIDGLEDGLNMKTFIDILINCAKLLEISEAQGLIDSFIHITSNKTMSLRATFQQNEIVASYFNVKDEQKIFSGELGVASEIISLTKGKKGIKLFAQNHYNLDFIVAELRLMLEEEVDCKLNATSILLKDVFEQKCDFVYNTPRFGLRLNDEEYKAVEEDFQNRFVYYGLPSKVKSEMGTVVASIHALKENGKAAFYLTNSALTRGGADAKIRERLIEADIIETIIEFPTGLWSPITNIAPTLLLINKNKPENRKGKICLINASHFGEKIRMRTELKESEINRIKDLVNSSEEVSGISTIKDLTSLKQSNLLPSMYEIRNTFFLGEYGEVEVNLENLKEVKTIKLHQAAMIYRGYNALPKKQDDNGNFSVVKIADIHDGKVKHKDLTRYQLEGRIKVDNYRMQQGDIALSIRGLLKMAIFNLEKDDVLLSQNFVGIRCNKHYYPEFLLLYLESPTIQFLLQSKMVGTTVVNLPIKEIETLPIPVLSMEEQKKIVEDYNKLMNILNSQLHQIKENLVQVRIEAFNEMGIGRTFKRRNN